MSTQSHTTKGFSLIEILMATAVISIYIVVGYGLQASLAQALSTDIVIHEHARQAYEMMQHGEGTTTDIDLLTRKTQTTVAAPDGRYPVMFEKYTSDTVHASAQSWCSIFMSASQNLHIVDKLDVSSNIAFTGLSPYGRYIVATSDTAVAADPDVVVIDTLPTLHIVGNLTTGPGAADVVIAGKYAFIANTSTTAGLQVVDLSDPLHPALIASIKLPLPNASSTAPHASTVTYADGIVILGTEKWEGSEIIAFNVTDPRNPQVAWQIETNSLVQDLAADVSSGTSTMLYVALSNTPQFAEYRFDATAAQQIWTYTPTGWQTQEGKSIGLMPRRAVFGRTVGGFNVVANHEFFAFDRAPSMSLATSSDIGAGVYGLLAGSDSTVLATGRGVGQIEYSTTTISLGDTPRRISCSGNYAYAITQHSLTSLLP